MSWQPESYLAFADHRTRPAHDLIARIPLKAPRLIYDLGCGPGNSAEALAARWGDARIIGVDSSPEMLQAAQREGPSGAQWELGDLSHWVPEGSPDLLFSNAALQWVADQRALLLRWFSALEPGAVLAFQVPANHDGPPHTVIDTVLKELGLRARIGENGFPRFVYPQADYYGLLSSLAAAIDIWDIAYLQVLDGENPVLRWVEGTALVPILAALGAGEARLFKERLGAALLAHYPPESNGRTLLPFLRRFIVAVRNGERAGRAAR